MTNNSNLKLQEIQEKGFCNWCRNPLAAYTEKLTESNFIDVPGKKWGDGSIAQAVYCNECLPSEERKRQPKSAVNRNTLAEVNIESLLDSNNNNNNKEQRATTVETDNTAGIATIVTGINNTTTAASDSNERTRSTKSKK